MKNSKFAIEAMRSRAERMVRFNQEPKLPSYSGGLRQGCDVYKTAPSLNTVYHNTDKKDNCKYTGTLITGIATMHKSNAVPVVDQQQAVDISRMRR